MDDFSNVFIISPWIWLCRLKNWRVHMTRKPRSTSLDAETTAGELLWIWLKKMTTEFLTVRESGTFTQSFMNLIKHLDSHVNCSSSFKKLWIILRHLVTQKISMMTVWFFRAFCELNMFQEKKWNLYIIGIFLNSHFEYNPTSSQ